MQGSNVTPQDVIAAWKAHFPDFWPKGNRFFMPLSSITPGDVAGAQHEDARCGVKMSTGIFVLYADDESFSFLMPEGQHVQRNDHVQRARRRTATTVAQAQALIRAQDPLYELGMKVGVRTARRTSTGSTRSTSLAKYFGVDRQGRDGPRPRRQEASVEALRQHPEERRTTVDAVHARRPIRLVTKPFKRA